MRRPDGGMNPSTGGLVGYPTSHSGVDGSALTVAVPSRLRREQGRAKYVPVHLLVHNRGELVQVPNAAVGGCRRADFALCWENNATTGDAALKQSARTAIENAWTRKVGVWFSGWNACTSSSLGLRLQSIIDPDARSWTDGDLGLHSVHPARTRPHSVREASSVLAGNC